ncbi:MAG: hypothetical protein K0R55_1822 [Sporomusa sp.]|nr:hypothetical protein [Sporomusa sp.]
MDYAEVPPQKGMIHMNTKIAPGQKIKEIFNSLGEPYKIKNLGLSCVIYRNLGNEYVFEVSGLDNQRKDFNVTLFIWDVQRNRVIETIPNIASSTDLKDRLEAAAMNYKKISH